MGSAFNRGTRARPKWYVKYRDHEGTWRMRASGQPTKEQARRFLGQIESRVANGLVGIEERRKRATAGPLMEQWAKGLTNRNAGDDRTRLNRHVLPVFRAEPVEDIDIAALLGWIDAQRAAGKLSDASIRHNLNLLSRFFSWAVERGHAPVNPVRQIPFGRRPRQSQKRDVPWLDDDRMVVRLMEALPEPFDLMFYIGNRSGPRTGEISGLRMSDFDFLEEGLIRIRYSYEGPLKEDKGGLGKMKWAPAALDAESVLGQWLEHRKEEGAGPEELAFPCATRDGRCHRKELIESRWKRAAKAVECELTWYQATRHSFTSRALSQGASLDEVSSALGHSSPIVTKRYYDHFVRRSFSSALRAGLKGTPANVVPLKTKRKRRQSG